MKKLIGILVFGLFSLATLVSGVAMLFIGTEVEAACLLLAGILASAYTAELVLFNIDDIEKELKNLFNK